MILEQMKKRKWLLVVPVMIVLLLGITIVRSKRGKIQRLSAIKKGSIIDAVYGIGTVTARKTYQLRVGVAATIRDLSVREGEEVTKGAQLIYLEGLSHFTAPFAGTITSLPYKIGETIFPQLPVLTLSDLKDRYLVVSLEQRGAVRVEKNQRTRISFESLRNETFEGTIRTIFPNDAQFIVHVDVAKLPKQILPGMTADVAIEIAKKENVLLAPVAAFDNGKIRVERGNWQREIAVNLGQVDGEMAEILSGDLQEGDIPLLKK